MGGFAQNLIEGFAGAAGDQNTVNRIEKEKANKQALSHAELQTQTQSILDDVGGLQKKRAALDPKSPTYAQDIGDIDANLHKARQALTDLYHPANNPGALQHLGGFIKQHLGKQRGVPTTPAQAKESITSTIAGLDAAAAVPGQTTDASSLSPEERIKAERIKAGLEPRATAEKPEKFQGQLTTTTDANGTQHYWRVPLESGAPPEEVDFQGGKVQPKASGGAPIRAWKRKNGKAVSVLLDRTTNKEIPGSENPDIAPPAAQAGRISTGFYHWVDDNNQLHSTPETRTSMPAGSGGAGIPRTAGEAKDRILGTKQNAPTTAAEKKYLDAFALASKADDVLKHPNDAVNQKRLGVALERISAGRYTQVAMDYIKKAGWGNTIEEWANRPGTGALPADIVRQFVQGAHQERDSAKAAWDEARKGSTPVAQFRVPAGAPPAPQQDGHKLKANGQVIAVSKGGQWVAP